MVKEWHFPAGASSVTTAAGTTEESGWNIATGNAEDNHS